MMTPKNQLKQLLGRLGVHSEKRTAVECGICESVYEEEPTMCHVCGNGEFNHC